MKIGEMKEDDSIFWIDRDNFIYDDLWYRVTGERANGRIQGIHYWRQKNNVVKATILTEAGVADSRPKESEATQ